MVLLSHPDVALLVCSTYFFIWTGNMQCISQGFNCSVCVCKSTCTVILAYSYWKSPNGQGHGEFEWPRAVQT